MKRKNSWILFAIILLSLTSLSPSIDFSQRSSQNDNNNPSSPQSLDSPNQETNDGAITISVQLSENDFNILDQMNKRFMQETGIQTELFNYSEESAYEDLSKALAIGEGTDVLLMESEWVKTFATKGYLLPVETYRKSTPESNPLRALLATVEWNGYQWSTPFDMDPYVLIWQSRILTEMGEVIPSTQEEWRNLLNIQKERKGKVLLGIDSHQPYALAALIAGLGGDILQPEDTQLAWIEEALPYMYLVSDNNKEQAWQRIKDGEMLLNLSPYSEARPSMKDGLSEGLSVDFPEHFYSDSPSFLRSRSFGVSSQSSSTEHSSEWIAYMTSYSNQQEWLDGTNRLPSLNAIYENPVTNSFDIPFRLEVLHELNSGEMNSEPLTNKTLTSLSIQVNQLLAGKTKVSEFKDFMLGEGNDKLSKP